jgi:hypothetical protein
VRSTAEATDGHDADADGDGRGRPGRRAAMVVGQLALVVAAIALAFVGFRAVADTTEGRAVDPVVDPDEPGYEAFVEPTPTLAVVGRRLDGTLDWVAVLVLGGPDQQGGTVVLVPPNGGVDTDIGVVTVAAADTGFGADGVRSFLADAQLAGIDEVVELSPGRLESLVAGVGELRFNNPDAAPGFPAGPTVVAPAAASAYLEAVEEGESQLTRLSRHDAFWRAWLDAIGASDAPEAVPGETATGIGRFLRGLAAGPATVAIPAFEPAETSDGSPALVASTATLADFAEEHIPFPASPEPGARTVVRVLDGVGADDLAPRAARTVVQAGGQVVIIGNAERFDPDAPTRVVYVDAEVAAAAEALAEAFGVEAEQAASSGADPVYDVTVVAGSDLLAAYGLSPRPPAPAGDDPTTDDEGTT